MEDTVLNLEMEQTPVEGTVNRGPGLKEPVVDQVSEVKLDTPAQPDTTVQTDTLVQPDPPVQQMKPAIKYGRRMDYKTAKVNDKQTRDLNLSLPSPPPPPANNHKKEEKSALELELEALEAKAASASSSSMIPNPLPTPKKRVPREMEFDIEPPEYAMHFDLVDMNGKDFFDIN